MEHNLKIRVSDKPTQAGIVSCRNVILRERLMRMLFGRKQKLTILIPGDTVSELEINKVKEGDKHYGKNEGNVHARRRA